MRNKPYRIKKRQKCPINHTELKSVKDAQSINHTERKSPCHIARAPSPTRWRHSASKLFNESMRAIWQLDASNQKGLTLLSSKGCREKIRTKSKVNIFFFPLFLPFSFCCFRVISFHFLPVILRYNMFMPLKFLCRTIQLLFYSLLSQYHTVFVAILHHKKKTKLLISKLS